MSTGGGGDHQSPPLPGGDFLLQLLQRPPPRQPSVAAVGPAVLPTQIQSNGRDLSHPPFAPHAYIHGYPANPNPTSTISDKFEKLGLFDRNYSVSDRDTTSVRNRVSGNTSEGNFQFNRFTDNFYSSPNTSRNPRNPNNGYEADCRNNQNRNGEGSNMVMNGYRTNHRSSPITSRDGSNRALNGYEVNYRNSPISNRIVEGFDRHNRALNGFEADYGNSPNSSRMGEGFDRSSRELNGFEADHRNSSRPSGTREGYDRSNRVLNGVEADFRNSLDSNGTGNGYIRVMNGSNSDFSNDPNRGGTVSRTGKAKQAVRQPPPGFSKKANYINNVDKEKSSSNGAREKGVMRENRRNSGGVINDKSVSTEFDMQAPPVGSTVHLGSGCENLESLSELRSNIDENGENSTKFEGDSGEHALGSIEKEDLSSNKNKKKKWDKEYRQDTRGEMVLPQGMRKSKSMIPCRSDIDILNAPLLSIYDSLVPPEEEKLKQKQLLTVLEKLVINEWPEARLLVYGSCANSFGVKNSDIDICLAMRDPNVNKSEILLKLANILEAENFENVQALTHARVPIVKLMDPVTGISCDICINNVLAVVNSKLLRDYARIDDRLRQLAFIVKHWAKSRGVNATYHGTLSSYAYVLMCIHFLQQCRPPILPCLQGMMDITYNVVVDNVQCAFFDQVEKLCGFGLRNRESIGQLLWGFFRYWAYCHDYAHDVVSVRVGNLISKRAKDWTRRVGNDRHLICIEDPFETTHDLGRVVDKFSIKVLREEFERAAEILQFDPNPCVTLFEPYVPS